jgi:hypothetical protein
MTRARALDASEVEAFYQQAVAAYEQAALRQGRSVLAADIAGIKIDIETAGAAVMDALHPALSGLATARDVPADARILVFDTEASGVPAPQFARPVRNLIRWRGDCWTEPTARCRVVYHMSDHTLQVFDPAAGICVVMIAGIGNLAPWALAAPLRTPLGMILETKGVFLVHGAAMGYADGAVLLTGYGGSGKSTATLSCYKTGMPVLGDDYVAIRPAQTAGEAPTVHNVFSSLKLMPQELGSASQSKGIADKTILYPFAHTTCGLLKQAPLKAVIAASIADKQTSHSSVAAPEDVARIAFASTALQIPMADEVRAARAILQSVQSTGAYHMVFGRDRKSGPDCIAALLATHTHLPVTPPPPSWARAGALEPVSVIIPVHNGSRHIGEAVASIAAEEYPVLEIIIVDDGSTDNLDAALSQIEHPFKLIRQDQRGPAVARNVGIQNAQHNWLAFLDADDLWPTGRLQVLARDLALHDTAGIVRGGAVTFMLDPRTGDHVNAYHPRQNYQSFIGGGLYRRRAFDEVGLFDETLTYAEDTDWYWRADELKLRVIYIADIVLHVRMHNMNMTLDKIAAEQGMLQALQRKIQRKRQVRSALHTQESEGAKP